MKSKSFAVWKKLSELSCRPSSGLLSTKTQAIVKFLVEIHELTLSYVTDRKQERFFE